MARVINRSKAISDVYAHAGIDTVTIIGGAGDDALAGNHLNNKLVGNDGSDALLGGGGNDRLLGGAGHDFLLGGGGKDRLVGGDGGDGLQGHNGNDRLFGGAGLDALEGGGGNDLLHGGADGDLLAGGAGRDVFLFSTALEADGDLVTDFTHADTFDFSGLGLAFAGNVAFSGSAGEIVFSDDGTDTTVSIDIDGDTTADASFTLWGVHTLTADDFVL